MAKNDIIINQSPNQVKINQTKPKISLYKTDIDILHSPFNSHGESSMEDRRLLEIYYFYLRSKNLTKKTIHGYAERLNYLIKHAHSINKALLELTKHDIQKFLLTKIDSVQAITINGRRKNWNLFYKFIEEEGLAPSDNAWENPVIGIPKMKETKRAWRLVTSDEMSKMIRIYNQKEFTGLRNQCLLLIAWDCMLRLNELLSLRITDLEFKPHKIIKVLGKGRKERILSFSNKTALKLTMYLNLHRNAMLGEILFPTKNNKKIDLRHGHRIFDNAARKARVPMRVGPHLVRRSAATHFWRKIGNLYLIKAILGHDDIRTTEIYVQAGTADIIKAYNQITPAEDLNI